MNTSTLSAAAGRDSTLRANIEFARHDGVRLAGDLYLPDGAGPHPLVIGVHGGGWQLGDAARYRFWGEWLAARGVALFAITYRLAAPGKKDDVCGIATLTLLDMAASKLLANSDRWNDDGVFSRDLIDLAMMNPALALLRQAIAKAEPAYGAAIRGDLGKAIDALQNRHGWLERCMQVMAMEMPKALLWQQVRKLRRVL